ncbi:MAG: multiheme c-type cytochrome [Candidatus Glassbacteria bacterium]
MAELTRVFYYFFTLTLILVISFSSAANAYNRYNDGCQSCHQAFTNDFSVKPNNTWPDSKHNVHRQQMLDNVCDACHLDGDGHNPYTWQSNGTQDLPGVGCIGCHGRDYGGNVEVSGIGLRAHHESAGVFICGMCHDDPVWPFQERVKPVYYGQPTVNVNESCNGDGSENWTPDGLGLDNDGDNIYDMDDGDCIGPPHHRVPVMR